MNRPMQVVCSADIQVLEPLTGSEAAVNQAKEYAPLAKALGFNAMEAYVRWDYVRARTGAFLTGVSTTTSSTCCVATT